MSPPLSGALRLHLTGDVVVVGSLSEFEKVARDLPTVSYLDGTTVAQVDTRVPPEPVIAICDGSLSTAISWLASHSWLSHVVSAASLTDPLLRKRLSIVTSTLVKGSQPKLLHWLGGAASGRRIRLTHSSKRAERLDRVGAFFESKGASPRTVEDVRHVAGELLSNMFDQSPEGKVVLPAQDVCDMVYALQDDLAIVRIRDKFGSLTRVQLLESLKRHAHADGATPADPARAGDEWLHSVFARASFVGVSVINNRSTEFFVGVDTRDTGAAPAYSLHLFFKEQGRPVRRWKLLDEDDTPQPSANHSVAIINK